MHAFKPGLVAALFIALLGGCSSNNDDSDETSSSTDMSADQQPTGETTSDPQTTDAYSSIACAGLANQTLVDEGLLGDDTVECGQVSVPADWNIPDGASIKLAVYRIPSTASAPAADPVVYLEGGPGGAGVASLGEFATGASSYLRERSDVIVIDQRGTGYSVPALYCPEVFVAEETDGNIQAAHSACRDRFIGEGVNYADYNSHNNALDINAVRIALGYEQWNLYGLSYGTRLALTIMRDIPDGVRSVILDSVFPIEVNGFSESAYPIYWTIDQIAINCAADADCSAELGDIKALIESGIARLDANPVGDYTAGAYVEMLSGLIAEAQVPQLIAVVANGSDDDIRSLLADIAEMMEEEEPLQLSELPPEFYPFVAEDAIAMFFAVTCAEEAPYLDNKAGPDISAEFAETTQRVINEGSSSDDQVALCNSAYVDVPAAGDIETRAVSSPIPTLVLAGSADVATPPAWSMLADAALQNSQYAEFDGLTHGLIGNNDCLNNLTLAYLDNPEAQIDQSCVLEFPRVDYVLE
jgi:pimeloyl-ACP methyl ester carboxylesterase